MKTFLQKEKEFVRFLETIGKKIKSAPCLFSNAKKLKELAAPLKCCSTDIERNPSKNIFQRAIKNLFFNQLKNHMKRVAFVKNKSVAFC